MNLGNFHFFFFFNKNARTTLAMNEKRRSVFTQDNICSVLAYYCAEEKEETTNATMYTDGFCHQTLPQ